MAISFVALSLFLLAITSQAFAQACQASTSMFTPQCILTFTPYHTPQTGPTTTIWEYIETIIYNVVDCRYCQVTNVQDNPAPQGPFLAKTTMSVLTIYSVGCMEETTAITRRHFRGYPEDTSSVASSPNSQRFEQSFAVKPFPAHENMKRQTMNASLLSSEAFLLITQLNTALYAIDLVNSGTNLTAACTQLQASEGVPDDSLPISFNQAADIVCFAASYGIDLNTTTIALVQDLSTAIYAVDLGSVPGGNTTSICDSNAIDYEPFPELGINTPAVSSFICGHSSPTMTVESITTTTTTTTTTTVSPTARKTTSSNSGASSTPNGYSGTGGFPGTAASGATGATGNGGSGNFSGPYATGSGSSNFSTDSLGIVFTTGGKKQPPNPNSQPFYPAVETSTITVMQYGGY